jgi:transposase InsO family protein
MLEMALARPELNPRELAVTFTDERNYFVSEAGFYRLLRSHDLITGPAFIVMKAADEFHDKTTAPNQIWQTDFTYLKVIGWGWFYLSTILDDYSRYIITWKLCTGMAASDVQGRLNQALEETGLDQANVVHRPRLLSGNGPCYISGDLADYLEDKGMPRTSRSAAGHGIWRKAGPAASASVVRLSALQPCGMNSLHEVSQQGKGETQTGWCG